jgi:hypothetical protein
MRRGPINTCDCSIWALLSVGLGLLLFFPDEKWFGSEGNNRRDVRPSSPLDVSIQLLFWDAHPDGVSTQPVHIPLCLCLPGESRLLLGCRVTSLVRLPASFAGLK